MPLSERLPGCRELLNLCDRFPNEREPLPRPNESFVLEENRRARTTRLNSRPYPSSSARSVNGVRSRKRKDTFDREEQRKAKLLSDPWSDKMRLTPKSVFCLGCKRSIRLDRRNDYYPGLWLKHRGLCHGIARARKEASEKQHLKKEEEKKSSKPPIDDEQAALILVEMMVKSRCFSDSDSSSSST